MNYKIIKGPVESKDFNNAALLREDRIVGSFHIEAAMRYAINNYSRQRMITRTIWNEIILYASLQRQITKAFEIVGIKGYSGDIIVVDNADFSWKQPNIEINDAKLSYWKISNPLEILERMALFHSENL